MKRDAPLLAVLALACLVAGCAGADTPDRPTDASAGLPVVTPPGDPPSARAPTAPPIAAAQALATARAASTPTPTPERGPATSTGAPVGASGRVVSRAAPPEGAATAAAYWTAERMASAVPVMPVLPGGSRPPATAPPPAGTPGAAGGAPPASAGAAGTPGGAVPVVGTAVAVGRAVTVVPAPAWTPTPVVLVSPAEVTLAADGGTVRLRVGERFRLALGRPFEWTPTVADPAVLRRVGDADKGVYEAARPGQTELTAAGDPPCRRARPACMAPSLLFRVRVLVR